jgi:hypothetical protein
MTEELEEDDGLGDLLDGYIKTADPADEADEQEEPDESPEETPGKGTTEEEPEDEPAEDAEEAEGGAEEESEEPEKEGEVDLASMVALKYKGKEYSWQDLMQDEELRTKVFTGANQQSHFQSLYEQKMAEADAYRRQLEEHQRAMERAQAEQQRYQQGQQPQQPVVPPELLAKAYKPQIEEMIKGGYLEEDLLEFYPNTAAGIMYLRENLLSRIGQLEAAIGEIVGTAERQSITQTKRQAIQMIERQFDALASRGDLFEPLSDPQVRAEFVQHLRETTNPPVQRLLDNPEILKNEWIAYNHEALMSSLESQRKKAESDAKRAAQYAGGDGVGNAKSSRPKKPKAPPPGTDEGWADL